MNAPNQLDQALETLRQEHRSIQPPPSIETSILQQTQLSLPHSSHSLRNWSFALAAAAALAIAIVLLYPHPSHRAIDARTTPVETPKVIQTPSPLHADVQLAQPLPHPKRPATRRQSSPGPFVPLPNGVGLPEPTQAMVIRTRIDTSSLLNYGLAPPPTGAPQTILAEFLVGEDGLPRAIRLVP